MELRPYQKDAIKAITSAYETGSVSQIVQMPTGSGKTVVMCELIKYFTGRVLILTHKEELIEQVRATAEQMHSEVLIGVEQAEKLATPMDQIVIACVPSLGRVVIKRKDKTKEELAFLDSQKENGKIVPERIKKFPKNHFSLLIIDEAHHATAKTYKAIIDYIECDLMVGFTATPFRADEAALDKVFPHLSFKLELKDLVPEYLSDIRQYKILSGIDISNVAILANDFNTKELEERLNVMSRNELIFESYNRVTPNTMCIIFGIDIAHCQSLEELAITKYGLNFRNISGLSMDDRRDLLERFHLREIDGIINCNILTEGFDEPSVETIILARPTRSPVLYMQMIGRGTRKTKYKSSVFLIDVCDNAWRNYPVALPKLFGLHPAFDCQGMAIKTELLMFFESMEAKFGVNLRGAKNMEQLADIIERLENLQKTTLAEIVRSNYNWLEVNNGFLCPLMNREYINIIIDRETQSFNTVAVIVDSKDKDKRFSFGLSNRRDIYSSIRIAEEWIRSNRIGSVRLIQKNADWRNQPVGEKQIEIMKKFGITEFPDTKGIASDLVSISIHNSILKDKMEESLIRTL